MKLSSLILGTFVAIAVIAGVRWVLGVSFHPPVSAQGAALYNPAEEITIVGTVQEVQEFDCPVSEGELASHLMLKTSDGTLQCTWRPPELSADRNSILFLASTCRWSARNSAFKGKKV